MPESDARFRLLRGPSIGVAVDAPVMHTPRLLLRPHRLADAESWYEMHSAPGVSKYTAWPQRTRRASLRHLKRRTRNTRLRNIDDYLAIAIEHNGELIGDVGMQLRSVSAAARCLEISWIIHPEHQGKGFAYEALRSVLDYVSANIEALLLVAVVHPSNAASIALAHKLDLHPLPGAADRTIFVGTNGPRTGAP